MSISICCIAKNEKDLKEWAIYHKLLGFDHIYIYDNNEFPLKFNLNFCTVIHYPGSVQQMNAYNHYLNNYKKNYDYVCVIDADEYVVLNNGFKNINEIINLFPFDHDAVILNWKLFINKNPQRQDGLVFETNKTWQKNYLKKDKNIIELNYNKAYKTIAKTDKIKSISNPHYFDYYENANVYCGDLKTKVEKINNPNYYLFNEPLIHINHYYVKSLEEFKEKCEKGRTFCEGKKNYENELKNLSNLASDDTSILYWVDSVKKEMEKL